MTRPKFTKDATCPKCGGDLDKVQYVPAAGVIKEYLFVQCCQCGYYFCAEPMDAQPAEPGQPKRECLCKECPIYSACPGYWPCVCHL